MNRLFSVSVLRTFLKRGVSEKPKDDEKREVGEQRGGCKGTRELNSKRKRKQG